MNEQLYGVAEADACLGWSEGVTDITSSRKEIKKKAGKKWFVCGRMPTEYSALEQFEFIRLTLGELSESACECLHFLDIATILTMLLLLLFLPIACCFACTFN